MKYDPGKRKNLRETKAYKNNTFMNSREARAIRIQCEMIEPAMRLKRSGVDHMITFFGSARLGRDNDFDNLDYHNAHELAKKIGVSAQQLQKYENAKNRISAARLSLIAKVLDKDISYFYQT